MNHDDQANVPQAPQPTQAEAPEFKPSAPSHIAYNVTENDDRAFYTRIGAAWPSADGNGLSVRLDAIPVDGRITLRSREALERLREERAQQQEQSPQQELKP
jgi:hypothetical protein